MDLKKLSKKELLIMCEKNGIINCKSKNKDEIIELIMNNENSKNDENSKNNKDKKIKFKIINNKDINTLDNKDVNTLDNTDINDINILDNTNTNSEKLTKQELKEKKEKLLINIENLDTNNIITDNVTLYYGDCIVEMDKIKDDSVDLILCDLPYGTTKCKWDTIIDLNHLWKHYKRIIKKPSGVILLFGQQPFTSMLVSSNYEWFKYNLIWKKNKTTQFLLANYRPMKCTEDICVFSKGGAAAASKNTGNMTYNPQGLIPTNIKKRNSKERIGKMLNQQHHLGKNNKLISNSEYTQNFTNYPNELIVFDIEFDTIHETQKPVKLIEYLIKTYSNEGDTVLDNTMGSGTTGVGCLNTNRKFIGIEKEEKYFKLSKYRITNVI
jgi:site-specific DNA-methyltransferase (adenine-specific)